MATYIQYCGSGFVANHGDLSIAMPGGTLKLISGKNHLYVEYAVDRTLTYITYFDRDDYVPVAQMYEPSRYSESGTDDDIDGYARMSPPTFIDMGLRAENSHLLAGRSLMSEANVKQLKLQSKQQSKTTYDYTTRLPAVTSKDTRQHVEWTLNLGELQQFRIFPTLLPDLVVELVLVQA